jgi:hypothetical protein
MKDLDSMNLGSIDISQVKVHNGKAPNGTGSGMNVGAHSYSQSTCIAMGPPGGSATHSIAHELTHTVQQTAGR